METTLHQQLKLHYASDESQTEVLVGRYRIDAVRQDELIEIQCASLSAISGKVKSLLKRHTVRVVKPVIYRTRIAKKKTKRSQVSSYRMSPKRGEYIDVFDDLIYFTRVFPHDNLILELPFVNVQQTRVPAPRRRGWRRKDFRVEDVSLIDIESTHEIRTAVDLFELVGLDPQADSFTTEDIAALTNRPRWFAQKIAYVLKHTGAISPVGRDRSGIQYRAA
ncbi:hypothetical protein [Rhodopirellula sp. MGV]|uniref:hypothetical protein n=1 Tax=Rhodopirellula sp. MGV TaxID=2023130 RepID=UPI000B963481|nr:hypothetical protein [Rhodopirellula sp. MGV]OYP34016.1 hypothetical protein CGZ80_16510 [Rhodopirellula sp. MGV]PNY38357.1 hypothetical protein C2E31_03345 [Rhodopirellula baltica]